MQKFNNVLFLTIMIISLLIKTSTGKAGLKTNKNTQAITQTKTDSLFTPSYRQVTLQKCDIKSCLPEFGRCVENTCFCNDGYANVEPLNNQNACSYRRKKQVIAFILEILFGVFGAGHLYLGDSSFGLLKFLLLIVLPLAYMCVFYDWIINYDSKQAERKSCLELVLLKIIPFIYVCLATILILTDLVLIGRNYYQDRNLVPVESW